MQSSQERVGMGLIMPAILLLMLILPPLSIVNVAAQDASAQNNSSAANNNVPGQNFTEEDFGPQLEEESASWLIIKTMLVLALFIGGFYYFYRFVAQKSGINLSGQDAIRILSTVTLGTNKFLQIVDVGGKMFLLGVTDNNINLLTEIKDKDEIDRIILLSSKSTNVQGATFQDFITAQIGWVADKVSEIRSRGSKKQNKQRINELSSKEFDMSYINNQKNRLKKLNGNDDE